MPAEQDIKKRGHSGGYRSRRRTAAVEAATMRKGVHGSRVADRGHGGLVQWGSIHNTPAAAVTKSA